MTTDISTVMQNINGPLACPAEFGLTPWG